MTAHDLGCDVAAGDCAPLCNVYWDKVTVTLKDPNKLVEVVQVPDFAARGRAVAEATDGPKQPTHTTPDGHPLCPERNERGRACLQYWPHEGWDHVFSERMIDYFGRFDYPIKPDERPDLCPNAARHGEG